MRGLKLQLLFLAVFSLSIGIIPFMPNMSDGSPNMTYLYINAGLIWSSLITLIIMSIIIGKRTKRIVKKKYKLGFFRFFSNKTAIIMDLAMVINLIALIILVFTRYENLKFIVIATQIFTVGLHCIFNSVSFMRIKEENRK